MTLIEVHSTYHAPQLMSRNYFVRACVVHLINFMYEYL